MNKNKLELKTPPFDTRHYKKKFDEFMKSLREADEKPKKLLPRYLPFIAKNNNDVNARAGSKGELDFHDFLKVLVEDWYCIHGIGKQMETYGNHIEFEKIYLNLI